MPKILAYGQIKDSLPWNGRSVTLVGGCFDVLHYGHLQFLQAAKLKAEILVIALESDEFIRSRKGRQPVHTQPERAKMLAALTIVDYIIVLPLLNGFADYEILVKRVRPQVIAVTAGDPHLVDKQKHADRIGAVVKVVTPLLPKFATSKLYRCPRALGGTV